MSPETLPVLLVTGLGSLLLFLVGHPDGKRLLDRVRRRARGRRLARVQGGPIPPLEVRFVRHLWPGRKCRKAAAEFVALGFRPIGRYRMLPTSKQGIILTGDEGRIVAEVWEESWKGLTVNVYSLAENGDVLEMSGIPDPHDPNPPWHRMVYTAEARGMVAKMAAFRDAAPWNSPLLVTRANYPEVALAKRRRFIEWHLANGRIRAHMVPGLERLTGMTADPASLEILRRHRP